MLCPSCGRSAPVSTGRCPACGAATGSDPTIGAPIGATMSGETIGVGISQGAVIWVYIGEVFPNRVRAKGQALGSSSHWIMNAIIAYTFPQVAKSSGAYPFMFFAAMMVLQFFVVLFAYPETKNISLEQMQRRLGID